MSQFADLDKDLPKKLVNKIYNYFNEQLDWFYIKHPKLNYVSPITYFRNTKDIETLYQIAEIDTNCNWIKVC